MKIASSTLSTLLPTLRLNVEPRRVELPKGPGLAYTYGDITAVFLTGDVHLFQGLSFRVAGTDFKVDKDRELYALEEEVEGYSIHPVEKTDVVALLHEHLFWCTRMVHLKAQVPNSGKKEN